MRKKALKISLFIFILIIPFATFFLVVEELPNQYGNTYVAELEDKYDLLNSTDEKKIIFVGGSSLPFGLRSDLIERELSDYKVVNFGLYATLGTKLMMDLSKVNINQGDIVILSPEISTQTYSLYFNPDSVLQACDGFAFKYKHLTADNNLSLFYNYYKFAFDKVKRIIKNSAPDPIGIYRHDSFNEYGDIAVDRPNNIMNNGVDSTMSIAMNDELLDSEFLDYVNEYCRFVRSKKAKIYFNFSPCNELAISSSKTKRKEFQKKLDENIECDLLTDIEDVIIDYGYFYDTNFHLNSAGAIYYTNLLVNNIKIKLGIDIPVSDGGNQGGNTGEPDTPDKPSIEVPKPPKLPDVEVVEPEPSDKPTPFEEYNGEPNNDYLEYFNFRLVGSSYQITGVKDKYKNMEEVILPSTKDGKNITTVATDAFYGCINLKRIRIGKTYTNLQAGAFNGCISLEGIYIYEIFGNKISPSSDKLFEGASRNVKIYVLEGSNFETDYNWTNYVKYLQTFKVKER